MTKLLSLGSSPDSRRLFTSLLLAFSLLITPIAATAQKQAAVRGQGPVNPKSAGEGATKAAAKDVFANPPAPAAPLPPATVTATMTAAITTDADSDAKADPSPADAITYTTTVTNNTGADISGLQFNDTVDPHTTIISGSAVAVGDDDYSTIGNVNIVANAAQGVLVNDFNPNTGNNTGVTVTTYGVNGNEASSLVANSPTTPTSQGGTISVNTDGSFTYDPKVGFAGPTDTFKYTTNLNGTKAVATVRITISGMIWFIKNSGAAGGACSSSCDGRLSHPFQTLTALQAVNGDAAVGHPQNGDSIFVYESSADYVGPITLRSTQKFIGQDATATIETITGLSTPSGSTVLPTMNATPATVTNITASNANGINLGVDNTLRGFTVGNVGTGIKISGTSFGTLTVGNNTTPDVTLNGTGEALSLTTGTFAATSGFVSVSTTSSGSEGLILSGVAGTASFGSTTITSATTQGIFVVNSSATVDFGNTSIGVGGSIGQSGVRLDGNTTGTRTFGTLNIQNAAAFGFLGTGATGGGNATINGAATINSANSGVIMQGQAAGTTINFAGGASITTTGSTFAGVFTSNTNVGTLTFESLAVQTNAGAGMNLSSGGTINVTNASGNVTSTVNNTPQAAPAIIANGVALNANFSSIKSSGGTNGVSLTNVTGTSNFGGGTLSGASGATFLVSGGTTSVTYSGGITQANNAAMVSITDHATGTITFQTGTLSATNGTGLQFSNADGTYNFNGTNTLNGGDAGIDIVAGSDATNGSQGTFSFSSNTSITNPTGTCFVANGSKAGVTYSGNITKSGTSTGLLVDITNEASGTITFQTGTLLASSTAAASTGIQLSNADGTVNFNGTNTLNGAGGNAGIDIIAGCGGTFSFSSNTAITNPSGIAYNEDTSTATVTYNGTISQSNAASAVKINAKTGGTTLFQKAAGGQITASTSTVNAIDLTNTGGTVTFTGGLSLTTTSGVGFNASGSGATVNATQDNTTIVNTISSTTGTALNVSNTTIGASNLTFRSISANGGTNGIVLNSTGASGGLTVTGNGSACTIATPTCDGGSIQSTTGTGILLTSTKNVSLTRMKIQNSGTANAVAEHEIGGTSVNGFSIADSIITDTAGDNTVDDGINLSNTTGAISITSTAISGARHQGITIDSTSGTISSLTMTGSTITGTPGGDGMLIQMRGTSVMTTGTIGGASAPLGNTFSSNSATGLQINNSDTGSIASITIQNNTFTSNNAQIDLDLGPTGTSMTAVVQSNTLNGSNTNAINLVTATMCTGCSLTASIKSNNIGTQGTFDSGSKIGNGIRIANGGVTTNLTIDSNLIREVPNGRGIDVEAQAYNVNNNEKVKITNNTIARPSGTAANIGCGAGVPCPSASIFILSDSNNLGGFDKVCSTVSGNTAYDPRSWASGGENAFYFARRTSASNTLNMEGTQANVTAQVTTTNTVTNLSGASGVTDENTSGTVTIVPVGTCGSFPALLLADGGVMSALTAPSLTSSLLIQSASNSVCADNNGGLFAIDSKITYSSVDQPQLDAMVSAAIDRWAATGLSAQQIATLRGIKFEVTDLSGAYLGEADGNRIQVDRNAGGRGWFIDPGPLSNASFTRSVSPTRFYTDPMNDAAGHVDLFTAIEHEMGHKLGLYDSYAPKDRDSIMYGYLTVGERRIPRVGEAKGAKPEALSGAHFLKLDKTSDRGNESDARLNNAKLVTRNSKLNSSRAPVVGCSPAGINGGGTAICVDIPTIHNGDSITISFQVMVNNPPNLSGVPPGTPQVSNFGTVTGGFAGSPLNTNTINTPVDLFNTTTTVQTSGSPSNQGDSVTFTATVAETPVQASADPTGTVQFLDGATPLTCSEGGVNGIRPLSGGSAACTTTAITPAGSPHTINANYSGDGNFDPSSGSVQQTVIACGTNPVVTNTNDSGAGSLRDAITNICGSPNNNITFNIPNGDPGHSGGVYTISLTSAELAIVKNVNITGPNSITNTDPIVISGNNARRVFNVNSGKTVSISGLTISNGNASIGGGIYNQGTLTLTTVTVSGNSTNGTNTIGGGIANGTTSGASILTIINSTISGNSANGGNNSGGGIVNSTGGGTATLTIINSTISGNSANSSTSAGGGIYNSAGGGAATVTITNSTVTGNTVNGGGGGISISGSGTLTTRLSNTIVAGNTKSNGTTPDDIFGTVDATSSFNLIGDSGTAGGLTDKSTDAVHGNIVGNAGTGTLAISSVLNTTLANNGGPTKTHALVIGSAALDAGSNALAVDQNAVALTTDQRGTGFARVVNTTVDIGAFEAKYAISATAGTPQSAAINTAFGTQLKATVTESGNPVSGIAVTFTAPSGATPSGAFSGSATVTTDGSGFATAPVFTANGMAGGPYNVVASIGTGQPTASFALTNLKANQSITVNTHAPASAAYNSSFTVAATSSSGLPVAYSSSGSCTNVGATFTMTSPTGVCSVMYNQGGDTNYNAAPQVTESVNSQKANQSITVNTHAPASAAYNSSFTVAATSSSGLTVAYSSSGGCSNVGATFTMTSSTVACTVKYDQAGDANYNAATQVTESVTAQKANQTITVNTHAPANATFNGTFTVAATSNSGLTVAYSSGGSCTNVGAIFTMTSGTGTCTVKYDQAGDANYNAATQVTESVTAQKANQTITVNTHAPASAAFNGTFTVAATSNSSLTVAYSSSGSCTNVGATFTMTSGTGTCTVKYDQAGNGNYNAATQVIETVNAQKASQTITVNTHAPASAAFNGTFTVAATSNSSLTVAYSSSGSCTNVGATFTMTSATGTCSVKYDQAGDANYSAATQVTESVNAQKASQTITVNTHAPASAAFNGTFTVAATSSSALAVAYSSSGSCTNVGATFTMTSATGICTVKYDQPGDANYNAATQVTESVNAQKANQAITFGSLPAKSFGSPDFTVSASASSGLTVSFIAGGVCTVAGATVHLTGTGTCTITAQQAGNANYNAAPDVPQSFQVSGSVISLSQSTYNVTEAAGLVTVTVNRTGDSSTAVTVDYATDDTGASANCAALNTGLANSRCDFITTLGTLRFAAGETQKTIDIPINQDSFTEGPETFTLNLTNITGNSSLSTPASATVTISDSAPPAGTTNAIDDNTAFVRQQYHDFLNREPDAAGLTFWVNGLNQCSDPAQRPAGQTQAQCLEVRRVLTSAAFFLSIEFMQTGTFVRSFYVAALNRPLPPSAGSATDNMPSFVEWLRDTQAVQRGVIVGQGSWQATLAANRLAFMQDFVMRTEFVGLYPTTDTPTQYINKTYQHALGRSPSSTELSDALSLFGSATTANDSTARGQALQKVTQASDFVSREMPRTFVQMEYFGYLRRNPNDPPDGNFNGYNFWLNKLNQFNGDFFAAEMVKAFIASNEYRTRFGP